jgi:hypothetical protein
MRKSNRSLRSLFCFLLPFLCLSLTGDINKRDGFTIASAGGTNLPNNDFWTAWYDMDDNVDDRGSYNLTEANSPSYTSGYGSSLDTGDVHWSSSSLGSNWMDSDGDWTAVVRFRAGAGASNGTNFHDSGSTRAIWVWSTAGCSFEISNVSATGPACSTGTWYTAIIERDTSEDDTILYWDDETATYTGNGSDNAFSGTTYIGGSSATVTIDMDFDFVGYASGLLTADQKAAIFDEVNGDGLVYADFPTP